MCSMCEQACSHNDEEPTPHGYEKGRETSLLREDLSSRNSPVAERVGYIILTSILTPLGKVRFVSASMIFGVGLMMSINRL